MMSLRSVGSLALSLILLAPGGLAAAELAGSKPNIIFVLTDDQGYGDVSAHGNPVLKTPHLDAMHAQSLRFTNWFNSPTCAPTRSALLTGRHEFRNGITHTIFERERLDPKATTLAQVLKNSGYQTGIFGKWHLGDEAEYQPQARGFQEVFIHGAGGIGQSYPGSCGDAPGNSYFDPYILHNGKFEHTKGYCTDVFFQQARQWISQSKEKPFFCWIATNAPHGPYHAKPEDKALYAGKALSDEAASFLGMVHNIDQNMGALLKMLDEEKLSQNTLVIFMNDNGGTAGVPVYNAGMRASKGTPWLGGTRGISFWRWLGRVQAGDCGALTAHLDVFKTLSALAGVTLPPALQQQSAEGRSLLPLLAEKESAWEDRYLFTHVGRWQKGADPDAAKYNNCAVRNTQYTLVQAAAGQGRAKAVKGKAAPAAAKPAGWELYDVVADPGQTKNIASEKPDIVSALSAEYDKWWASLKGQYDINENVKGPRLNPFAELYWKQYGGGPSAEDAARMNPEAAFAKPKPKGK